MKKSLKSPKNKLQSMKFTGGMPPNPPQTINFVGPHFLYLPWAPTPT